LLFFSPVNWVSTKHIENFWFQEIYTQIMQSYQFLKIKWHPEQMHPSTITILACWPLQIITKFDRSMALDLHSEDFTRSTQSRNCGKLLVHAEECVSSKTTVEMTLRCSDLEYRDLFSRSVCICICLSFLTFC